MWQSYYQPTTLFEALELLHEHAGHARIVAGGTDLLVELQRGVRPTSTAIDISRIDQLRYICETQGSIRIGALATHNDLISSETCREQAAPLVQACSEVGAPQIRTRATLAGNLVTASPANDTITPLIALEAEVVLSSISGERMVPLRDFYRGVRRTALQPDELLREVRFEALSPAHRSTFVKLGLRGAQAISVINLAVILALDTEGTVTDARIALGCLAPTIVRAGGTERFLIGRALSPACCAEAGRSVRAEVKPIDDLRGSAGYRLDTLEALLVQSLTQLAGSRDAHLTATPILLDSRSRARMRRDAPNVGDDTPPGMPDDRCRVMDPDATLSRRDGVSSGAKSGQRAGSQPLAVIETTINGRPCRLEKSTRSTLLQALREEAGLTGTKEGCAEGECGACTVWIDGQAVMSCLVPAGQAQGVEITTIEGLHGDDRLHPLQEAFVHCAAVQCGYCIPGMLMSGAMLLEEHPHPDLEQARMAISGNLCRCTGYRKILDAIFTAAAGTTDASPEAAR